jgi:hypothetical protein
VVVVVLLLDGDELMLPLEPELLPPDEPELPALLGLLLEPPEEPDEPDEPDEPELPIEVLPELPELPEAPLEPLAESDPPPLPQALRDRAAAATMARTVLRERVDAFMRGNSLFACRGEGCQGGHHGCRSGERRPGRPSADSREPARPGCRLPLSIAVGQAQGYVLQLSSATA